MRGGKVPEKRRRELKRSLVFMRDVGEVDPTRIEWGRLCYHRNNGSYRLLMNVCFMVVQKLYALTEAESDCRKSWDEIGCTFHCRTLDLGRGFSGIVAQLDEIAKLIF